MKKYLYTAALLLSTPLWALRPGAETGKIDAKIKWINSVPAELGKVEAEKRKRTPELRALVFFFCRAANSDATIAMLEQCRLANAGAVQIIAITPDPAAEAEEFARRHKEVRVRIAVDLERNLTPRFTEGSMLLPMAFLIDRDGNVLWCGEAVDLAEAVRNVLAGKNDVKLNAKLAPLIDEMQQWMRDGSEMHMANTAIKIFEICPGQPTALRMRLFSLENSGRIEEAMQLINAQIKAAPQLTRLYFTALDLLHRYPTLRGELPSLTERFALNPASTAARCTFADALIVNFSVDIRAIEGARTVLEHTPLPQNPADQALLAQSRARLSYVMTDLDGAIAAQKQAVEVLKKSSDQTLLPAAEKQLDFFTKLKALKQSADQQ